MFLFFSFKKYFTYSVHNEIHLQTTTENKWNKEQSKYGEGTQESSGCSFGEKNCSGLHYTNGYSVLNFVSQVLAFFFGSHLCLVQIKTGQEIIERFYVVLLAEHISIVCNRITVGR